MQKSCQAKISLKLCVRITFFSDNHIFLVFFPVRFLYFAIQTYKKSVPFYFSSVVLNLKKKKIKKTLTNTLKKTNFATQKELTVKSIDSNQIDRHSEASYRKKEISRQKNKRNKKERRDKETRIKGISNSKNSAINSHINLLLMWNSIKLFK